MSDTLDIIPWDVNVKEYKYGDKIGISISDTEIKGFTVKYNTYLDYIEASAYVNDRYAFISSCEGFRRIEDAKRAVNVINSKISERIFTDEELVSPCKTIEEYERRMEFITRSYIRKVNEVKINELDDEEFDNNVIYDPVSQVYVSKEDEKFVKHHIWLYHQVKSSIKQSIVPIGIEGISKARTFMTYYTCIKYAEDDDPCLNRVKEYVKNNARNFAKACYKGKGSNAIPIWLVKEGYIKAPTMKILLDMANKYGDAQLAAVIMETMKNKKKGKSEFKL